MIERRVISPAVGPPGCVDLFVHPSLYLKSAIRGPDRPEHLSIYLPILFNAPFLPTFAASSVHCIKMLTVPCSVLCGTRTTRTRRQSDIA